MNALTSRQQGFIAALVALAADQGSKLALLYAAGFVRMAPGDTIPVLPFFNLVMVWNPGISYGLLPASGPWGMAALITMSLVAIAGLSYWLWHATDHFLAIGLGFIIGGAVGNNLIDRVLYGRVADFFHFYAFGYDWYVFNVADVAIVLGAVAMLYEVIKPAPQTRQD